jgi:hypothetical protein
MNPLKIPITNFLIVLFVFGCSVTQTTNENITYFEKFDLFKLSGQDTILITKIKERKNREYVGVSYINNLPNLIRYYFPNRQVILQLENNFKSDDGIIYVYSTGNLLGGKAGRQKEYSFHYIDNAYKIYINLSDTIVVKRYDAIDAKSTDKYHYIVDVYTKKENQLNTFFLLQTVTQSEIKEDSLYKFWKQELKISKPEAIRYIETFPPK